jgi:integration host factor subunit alpha|tara:strand:+ start:853 stop:1143 length:291 start_codon:yes stop_codon:yes gene_type:complete
VSKNLTKIQIIQNLRKKSGFSINLSKKLINDLIDVLILNIVNNKLSLKNIGSFKLLNKKERIGRNPKTKKEFVINSRKSLSFIASKKLLSFLNQNK